MEYRLVAAGVATYPALGYQISDAAAAVPAVKLREWLTVDAEFKAAEREKANR